MTGHTTPKLLAVICILAAALTACRAGAQTSAAPAGQSTSSSPPAAAADTKKGAGCNTIPIPPYAGGASVVQATGESLQHKSWQANGGEIEFTVRSFVVIPPNASVLACFRWKTIPESKDAFIEMRPSRFDLNSDGKLLKVTTTVPDQLGPWPNNISKALPLVPLAQVRILAIDNQTKAPLADVTTAIGITHPVVALVFAIATIVVAFVVLRRAVRWRLRNQLGIMQANWLLRIISTPSGFASLSQFQILLWTFIVAAAAVYVMSLSGELIQISSGTLVLLGIAGLAAIGAKAHSETQGTKAEATATRTAADHAAANVVAAQTALVAAAAPTDPVAAAQNNQAATQAAATAAIATATRARADAIKNPPATQIPRWSDLIVNESVKDDGTVTRELDMARFQMLLFTLITAAFVVISVVTSYVIPEISTGFQTLMGISNGVYIGSKVVQGS